MQVKSLFLATNLLLLKQRDRVWDRRNDPLESKEVVDATVAITLLAAAIADYFPFFFLGFELSSTLWEREVGLVTAATETYKETKPNEMVLLVHV